MPQFSLASTAFSAGAGGMASMGNGAYTAKVALDNQTIANQNANLATFKGNQQVGVSQQRTAQIIGVQTAGAGASGVDVNSGTPLRDREDTARVGSMDVQTIKQNAARSAWGYQVQAENFGQEAKLDQAKGYEGLFSSLIGGAGQFADKWTKYQQQGMGG